MSDPFNKPDNTQFVSVENYSADDIFSGRDRMNLNFEQSVQQNIIIHQTETDLKSDIEGFDDSSDTNNGMIIVYIKSQQFKKQTISRNLFLVTFLVTLRFEV